MTRLARQRPHCGNPRSHRLLPRAQAEQDFRLDDIMLQRDETATLCENVGRLHPETESRVEKIYGI